VSPKSGTGSASAALAKPSSCVKAGGPVKQDSGYCPCPSRGCCGWRRW